MVEEGDNKRIAKNTLLLYGRSLISMVVGLYTSRIILEALGIPDFGLYGAVGSIVSMFTILNGVLSAGTSRFLTFEIGREDKNKLNKTFSAAFLMHAIMAVVLFILLETVGLWFLNHKLNIPEGRTFAANVVYQFSILTCVLGLTQVPYSAVIIAREKMSIYAYVGLLEVLFKLALVALLLYVPFKDNLIAYAAICAAWSIGLQIFYRCYCRKNFEEAHLHIERDRSIYKDMLSYSMWDLIGQFCATGNSQGRNILLNMFFGVTLNAANYVANQVSAAVTMLNNNFTTSVQPQIVKSYARGDLKRFFELIYSTGKFSFFLIYILALPIALESPYILSLWLKEVPNHTLIFIWVTMIVLLLRAFANPIVRGIHATGKIKFLNFTSGVSSVALSLPLTYILFKLGCPFWSMLVVQLFVTIICNILEVVSLHRNVHFGYWDYFKKVYIRSFLVAILSAIIPVFLILILPSNFLRMLLVVSVSLMISSITIYFIGLDKETQLMVTDFIKKKVRRDRL